MKTKKNRIDYRKVITKKGKFIGGSPNLNLDQKSLINIKQKVLQQWNIFKDKKEAKFAESQRIIRDRNICNLEHEHGFTCFSKSKTIKSEIKAHLRNKYRAIHTEYVSEINYRDLDLLQEDITYLFFDDINVDDDIFILLEYTQGDFKKLLSRYQSSYDRNIEALRILKLFMELVEFYQDYLHSLTILYIIDKKNKDIQDEITRYDMTLKIKGNRSLSKKEKEFILGTAQNNINYIGTHEESCYRLVSIDGVNKVILEADSSRDIFMVDYEYSNFKGTLSSKMPLYKSTGTNMSEYQKGLLSPFNGFALNEETDFFTKEGEPFFIQLANILDINSNIEKKKFFFSCFGTSRIKSGNTIAKISEINYKNIYFPWLIKMDRLFHDYPKKKWLYIFENYPTFKNSPTNRRNRNKVIENLGYEYYKEQLKQGKVLFKRGSNKKKLFIFKDNPVTGTIETILNKGSEPDMANIFYHRYYANRDFYSFRNMAPNVISNPTLKREIDINNEIKTNNILGYDMSNYYITGSDDEKTMYIRRKIMSYFYILYSYIDEGENFNYFTEDLRKVLDKFRPNNNYQLIFDRNNKFVNEFELQEICDTLVDIGLNYLDDTYKDTLFYNYLKLPIYSQIKKPI